MAGKGITSVNFGAVPGTAEAVVTVSAPGLVATSLVEAWFNLKTTADHDADEHLAEWPSMQVIAGEVDVALQQFKVRVFYMCPPEPLSFPGMGRQVVAASTTGQNYLIQPTLIGSVGGTIVRTYGLWSVAYAWS